jgi:hypothetical protein
MQFSINARFNPTLVDLSHSRPRSPPASREEAPESADAMVAAPLPC